MPSLANLPGRIAGQPLTKAIYDQLEATHDYYAVAGADLASAAAIVPTNGFHGVTGSTTIDNINHAAPVSGQVVRLYFGGQLTIRNNGGGAGNIRTRDGIDRTVLSGEVVEFTYIAALWRETDRSSHPAAAGESIDYLGATLPPGFLPEDGSAVSRTTYAGLFAAVGTTHGVGDGSTTFNVPDSRGRENVGLGTSTDVDALTDNDGQAVGSRTPRHVHSGGTTGAPSATNNATFDNPSGTTSHASPTHTHAEAQTGQNWAGYRVTRKGIRF